MVIFCFEGSSRGLSLCNMNDEGIEACKASVSEPNPVDPSAECCSALAGADLECLCSYKDNPELPLLGIDPALAMALPAKCNLTTPANC
ncbi:putative lipid-transfer protein DIR1 [Senna tora]|uniref:Putative lipid-transfer protein DIR1 n=1 Tax=Senna tora TaxID=362788 RepID=A0A834XJS7_9FABA|nr:putative lipid-transfer protein DIR1 [Senna tora]